MGPEIRSKRLTIDLSCIKDAPEPTDVTIKIRWLDGAIASYSVTTAKILEKPAESPAYTIQKGDTPTGLAKKLGIPVSRIHQPLIIGQKLIINAN